MSQDRAQWRRKISEWSSAVSNHHRGRSTSELLSEYYIYGGLSTVFDSFWTKNTSQNHLHQLITKHHEL